MNKNKINLKKKMNNYFPSEITYTRLHPSWADVGRYLDK